MGHALGLIHEHQRVDRDENILILENNIEESMKSEYRLAYTSIITTHDVPYDLGSIMHYEFNVSSY